MPRETLNRALLGKAVKPLVFAFCLLPVMFLLVGAATDQLGANPAEAMIRSTGDWALRMLCITLAITPLRISLRLPALARLRRLVGLYVYFYALTHLFCYAWFDMGLDLADIARDIAKRPFILVGFATVVLLTPLAATSWNGAMKWLGGPRWQSLHRLVYIVAALAILHFFWMRSGKNNFADVLVYAALLSGLLGWRLWRWFSARRSAKPDQPSLA